MMSRNGKFDHRKFDDILTNLDDVPDYQVFLTVDVLKASTQRLAGQYPDVVEVLPVGHSRQGDAIEAVLYISVPPISIAANNALLSTGSRVTRTPTAL